MIALQQKNYSFITFEEWCHNKSYSGKYIILRHDVDEMAKNALKMAQLENQLGIRATYSFRIVKQSNKPDIIKQIVELGHEIGYHYEDLAFAKGDYKIAIQTFRTNLQYFRSFYNVKTISMHGSSTSEYDNKDLWNVYDFKQENIIGEPYFSIDYNKVFYLTDTGYFWDEYRTARRDVVKTNFSHSYHTTFDIISSVNKDTFPDKAVILAHFLWTDNIFLWYYIYIREMLRNRVKRLSRNNQVIRKIYSGFVAFYWKNNNK